MEQLSYISSPDTRSIQYITIPEKLKEQAKLHPNKEVFIFYSLDGERTSITFSELYRKSQEFSRIVMSLGIQKGDKVIIHLYNSMEWLIIVFGLMSIGAVPVGVYIVRKDASDINYVAEKTKAVAIFFTSPSIEIQKGIKRLVENTSSQLKYAVSIDIDEDDGNLLSFNKLLKMTTIKDNASEIILDPDNIALIMRSSGTTGRPKLIPHSHLSLQKVFSLLEFVRKMYANTDFSWMGGSPIMNIVCAMTRVTFSEGKHSVSTANHLAICEKESCSALLLTGDVLNSIIRDELCLPTGIDTMLIAGSSIKRKYHFFLNCVNSLFCGYAALEMGPISSIRVEKDMELEDNIGGYIVPGVEVKITNNSNQLVMRGTTGRIRVRRCNFFRGYFGDDEMTEHVLTSPGWFDTGDIGYISENNKLFVMGRDGECVSRGLLTIYASAIENTIMNLDLPEIQDIAIVPVPDEIYNEEICACVILKSGQSVTPNCLLQKFADMIQYELWRPKYVVVMNYFPVNANKKMLRKQIAEFATKTLEENK